MPASVEDNEDLDSPAQGSAAVDARASAVEANRRERSVSAPSSNGRALSPAPALTPAPTPKPAPAPRITDQVAEPVDVPPRRAAPVDLDQPADDRPDSAAPPPRPRRLREDRHHEPPAGHHAHHGHHDHHVLIDVDEDRWAWRRKIRQNPRQLVVYRIAVGFLGLLLVCSGLLTGPLPGPGGIPLVLLGLAVWSSEFEWAHRLMQWFKAQLHRFRGWTRPQQALFWVTFFTVCGALVYGYMLTLGVPFWVPPFGEQVLRRLPGI